jgi:uncharacterized protein YbjT (DUF2867 family)
MILVTGATGNNGTEIVKRLAAMADVQVRAMVRNRERASAIALPHVEVVKGDFDRPAPLLSALAGVERVFLLTVSALARFPRESSAEMRSIGSYIWAS